MSRKFLLLMAMVVLAAGCGVRAQSYIMTKERVDIAPREGGNAGYLMGDPQYSEPERKSRKIYILELTKPIAEKDVRKIQTTETIHTSSAAVDMTSEPQEEPAQQETRKIVIPKIDDEYEPADTQVAQMESRGLKEDLTYTVLKDDTLQKIAKKHYGSFSGWYKIYKANQSKIKNPNVVKPGTVLTIPADQ